ncbi:hydrolase [Caballeronia catudaia]|uniref:Hydrolase n=1 Tax=Caballeronia catudaia TaxID=1777136 RepID=A0A158DFC4_9BURK|nr:amidohydrolase family protein [Caballeronia catudaia]SAK93342.1 hydrolase [Caballeronia catudaia]
MSATPLKPASMPSFVDTHAHVFRSSLQLAHKRRYTPNYDAQLESYLVLLKQHGFGYGVLVQPSFLGTDNSHLLEALASEPSKLRGVAVVSPDISDDELARFAKGGVTGIRLNLIGQPLPDLTAAPWTVLWRRLLELGWHVELHRQACDLRPLIEPLLEAGLRVVVDHFGRPDPDQGTIDPGFRDLLGFRASGRVWVKISGAYRCANPATSFMHDASEELLDVFGPQRLMWGSDWPHTQFEDSTDFGRSVRNLQDLNLTAEVIDAILRSTPHAFYGFNSQHAPVGALATDLFSRTL